MLGVLFWLISGYFSPEETANTTVFARVPSSVKNVCQYFSLGL